MYTGNILALGSAFLALAAAVPLAKRDIVWVTETAETVVTVPVTATVWVNAGGSPVASAAATTQVEHAHSWPHFTSHVQTTVTVPSPSAAESTSVAPPSPTSVVVAPTTSSTTQQAPSPTVVVPSTPATTPVAAPTTTAAPAPTTTSAAPAPASTTTAASSGSSGSAPSGAVNTGDITHYDVGEGSCGWTNTDGEAVVAIAHGMMDNGANPNDNPLCGRMITISYQGRQTQAKVVDTCMGCDGASIDLSPTLFATVAPEGNGRVHGVEWWFDGSS